MRFFNTLSIFAGLAAYASATQSFAGSNLYYAAGLNQAQQTTLFTGLKDAGVKVLRVWLDGTILNPTNLHKPQSNNHQVKTHPKREPNSQATPASKATPPTNTTTPSSTAWTTS
jgi:hypothetical protein